MTTDCVPVTSYRILGGKGRCSFHVNPKRPTWRCKATAEFLLLQDDNRGNVFCPEHRDEVTCVGEPAPDTEVRPNV